MKLYQLTNEFQQTAQVLADMDLSPQEIKDNLACIQLDFDKKALNTGAVIKNLQIDVDALKLHENVIKERRQKIEKRIEEIQHYLLYNMQQLNITKVHGLEFDIAVRNNPPRAEVIDEKELPHQYMKEEFIVKVDKAKLRHDMLNGNEIKGAKLVQDQKLVIK